ncbi:glycosyltransferase family 4 protein [Vicingaceae bacterium]|nr:glycosyltransferase family 4 protein [Vicingaceae bacterium]
MIPKKLAIVVSHPIQYYAPLFAVLAKEIDLKVFYCHNPTPDEVGKDGFGQAFSWDIDLLKGYNYEFLKNVSKNPSVTAKDGCDTPDIGTHLMVYGATHVVVFGWYLKSHLQALEFCNKQGIPIAARGDSQLVPSQHWLKRLVKRLYYPFFLSRYDAFLSVGKRNRRYLEYYGVKSGKILFSPHAVDQDFWKVERVRHDKIVFVWVAKFIPKKRPFDVIESFLLALGELKDTNGVELHMVGTGELLEEAKQKSMQHSTIKFLGFKNQTELKPIYANSSSLILSSDYLETWGLVVNEGFASGLPAIVSKAAGCSQDMITNNTGMVYPVGNVVELKKCMVHFVRILQNKEGVDRFEKGIAAINKEYSFERNVVSFQEFLTLN